MHHKISFKSVKCFWLYKQPHPLLPVLSKRNSGAILEKLKESCGEGSIQVWMFGGVDLECLWEKAAELGRRVPGIGEGGWILVGGGKAIKRVFLGTLLPWP